LRCINIPYFQFYTGIIVGSSLLDLGCQIYNSQTHKHSKQSKIVLAISRALQNTSFVMPIFWIGYQSWKSTIHVNDPMTAKITAAAFTALPFGFVSYLILGLGLNPVFALGPPRTPKDLTVYLTNSVCNIFRILNITAVSASLSSGKISLPSALVTISACLVTMVAQGHLFEIS
jgi:hypothetical protein